LASALVCDLADAGAIASCAQEAKSRLGGIDVLVNNAGIGRGIPLVESSDEYIDQVLAVNLRAVMLLTREVLRFMLEQGDGSIINIASQAAKRGYPDISHYSASKAGVLGFTIALAVEVAPVVRVNAVCPGMVETTMMKNNIEQTSREQQISYQAAYDQWRAPIPLGRLQQPEDVSNGVLFLASEAASEITGEALNVSGGLVMW
jgi:NAD(P)-dependent dehydrogenase (short-subunit alcohol dehydrogenase family)